ncbi:MAG TPA: tRNA uridine-5-carboxymethylaminomethyl(34) synthesis GTPase MnmE, partial [Candidatus Scatomorpha stercoravium]|nr:tRNA uridine-5-carboxymethylaminomethyl(34) synthesis GTPase MnmE [Candidatus Scatomorpha stercoravium]
MGDTIAAIATGGSVAAIGIVRVSGPDALRLMDELFRPADGRAMSAHPSRQLVYGALTAADGGTLDRCLCT